MGSSFRCTGAAAPCGPQYSGAGIRRTMINLQAERVQVIGSRPDGEENALENKEDAGGVFGIVTAKLLLPIMGEGRGCVNPSFSAFSCEPIPVFAEPPITRTKRREGEAWQESVATTAKSITRPGSARLRGGPRSSRPERPTCLFQPRARASSGSRSQCSNRARGRGPLTTPHRPHRTLGTLISTPIHRAPAAAHSVTDTIRKGVRRRGSRPLGSKKTRAAIPGLRASVSEN